MIRGGSVDYTEQSMDKVEVGTLSALSRMICDHFASISMFNESAYILNNKDVASELSAGRICSGYYHWVAYGEAEGRDPIAGNVNLNRFNLDKDIRLLLISLYTFDINKINEIFCNSCPAIMSKAIQGKSLWFLCNQAPPHEFQNQKFVSLNGLFYAFVYLLVILQSSAPFMYKKREILYFLKICRDCRSTLDSVKFGELYWLAFLVFAVFAASGNQLRLAASICEFIFKARHLRVPLRVKHFISDICAYSLQDLICLSTAYYNFLTGRKSRAYAYLITFCNSLVSLNDNILRPKLKTLIESLIELSQNDPTATNNSLMATCLEFSLSKAAFIPHQTLFIKKLIENLGRHRIEKVAIQNEDQYYEEQHFDFVFVIGEFSETKQYRVFNIFDELTLIGKKCVFFRHDEIDLFLESQPSFTNLILMRCGLFPHIERIIAYARSLDASVIYDIDDIFYDSKISSFIRGVENLPQAERCNINRCLELFRSCLVLADMTTAPTNWLVQSHERFGLPAGRYVNSVGHTEDLLVKFAKSKKNAYFNKDAEGVYIGYFSGSWTHDVDFEACKDALTAILSEFPYVYYVDTGYVTLPEEWSRFKNRILRFWSVPHSVMLLIQLQCDIVIAPLEKDNIFCDAKSELKYFEAALSGVPIVATPTPPMAEAIKDGINGFLALDSDQWSHKLRILIENTQLRQAMGQAAFAASSERYVASSASSEFINIISSLERSPQRKSLKITFICTDYCQGSGGQRNYCNLASMLTALGHKVVVVMRNSIASCYDIKQLLTNEYGSIPFAIKCGDYAPGGDIIIATHHSTVDYCLLHKQDYKKLFYYVQDFEPWFYNIGDDYFEAEQTYYSAENIITYTPFVKNILQDDYGIQAKNITMFIDRAVYYKRNRHYKPFNILIFARPEMPRRCFRLVNNALTRVGSYNPKINVRIFGSEIRPDKIDFEHDWLGSFTDYDALADLYSNSDIGIAISPTNPSHMPFEMMACGLPVVDISWKYSRYNHPDYAKIATCAAPNPDALAKAIIHLIQSPEERKEKSKKGIEMVKGLNLLPESAREFEEILLRSLSGQSDPSDVA